MEKDSITSLFIVYRYDITTGTFTVLSGGDGFYYFSAYLTVWYYEIGWFDIQINGEMLCTALGDANDSTFSDTDQASCSAVVLVAEGKILNIASYQKFSFPL